MKHPKAKKPRQSRISELAEVFLADAAKREDAAVRRHAEILTKLDQTREVFHQGLAATRRLEKRIEVLEAKVRGLEEART